MNGALAERLQAVTLRVADACRRAGRDPAGVRVLAVAKAFGPDAVWEAAEAGLSVIGENRVQEARAKIPLCPGRLSWHLVGHLQSNKAREAVRLFDTIQSVDSPRLLSAIDAAAAEEGRRLPVLLEVNVSGEGTKFGLRPEEVPVALDLAAGLRQVEVRGFLTVPPASAEAEGARPFFRRMRELRDGWARATGLPLEELSMGMSHDFEVAIEEGATWVRLGTALFGPRTGKTWRPAAGEAEE